MSFDFQKIFDSKTAQRRKLADLPIGEKLTLLDAMRERAIAIRNATPQSASSILQEEATLYRTDSGKPASVKPLNDPDFIGMDAAIRRASAKAIAKARAAGLEPIVSNPEDLPKLP